MANKKNTITIQLRRSVIGCSPLQRAAVRGLGLKKREQVRTLEDTPSIQGMIKKVAHLITILKGSKGSK